MPDTNEAPPIIADASPARDQASAAVRGVILALGVVSTLAGLLSKHNWAGFITYMQSNDFLTALAFVISAATFAWGQWKARHRSKQLTAIAADPRVPDAVATVKS